jgi:hypothetical protein
MADSLRDTDAIVQVPVRPDDTPANILQQPQSCDSALDLRCVARCDRCLGPYLMMLCTNLVRQSLVCRMVRMRSGIAQYCPATHPRHRVWSGLWVH